MIKNLEISNYRSCNRSTFAPRSDLSVLIGPNGSGKTNILNSILLLQKLCQRKDYENDVLESAYCNIKVKFEIKSKRATFHAKVFIETDEKNNDVITGADEYWVMPDITGNRKRVNIPLASLSPYFFKGSIRIRTINGKQILTRDSYGIDSEDEALQFIQEVREYLLGIKYYSASQFTNPSQCPVSFEIKKDGKRSRGLHVRGHSKFLYDLYSASQLLEDSYSDFLEIIGPDGIGLIDDLTFKEISTSSIDYTVRSGGKIKTKNIEKILVIPQFTIGQNELSPNQLSDGTFKTITLLFYLVTEASSLLLIEEPEVCIHHGLLSSVVELIISYSSEKEIVITTHSDFLLDKVKPENIFKVSNYEKGTTLNPITKSMPTHELLALKKYLLDEGNLGEYWRHGGLD